MTTMTFEALVERHSDEIHAYLWRLLGDPELAADALQDTFLRAFKAYPSLRHHDHLRAWLYTIATNRARTLQRERVRRQSRQAELHEELRDAHDSVAAQAEARDLRQRVRKAVDRLPLRQRQALILRRYQGMAYDEIAAIVGGTVEAARSNVHLAQHRLRTWLREGEAEWCRSARKRGVR